MSILIVNRPVLSSHLHSKAILLCPLSGCLRQVSLYVFLQPVIKAQTDKDCVASTWRCEITIVCVDFPFMRLQQRVLVYGSNVTYTEQIFSDYIDKSFATCLKVYFDLFSTDYCVYLSS